MRKSKKQLEKEAELQQLLILLTSTRSKWQRKNLTSSVLAHFGYIHDTPAAKQHWINQVD